MNQIIEQLQNETRDHSAQELLVSVHRHFGDKIAFASSLGAEDQVLTDMLCKHIAQPRIFTLDTGRLAQATYNVIAETNKRYGITIKMLFPDRAAVEAMVNTHGPNLFYDDVASRKMCCKIRKVAPLRRALLPLEAWVTGLRKEQAVTRQSLRRIAWDADNGLVKVNALADWTVEQVWSYIKANDVPYNKLHDQGYPSIGCVPCTRAIKEGEDIRAGRWWWELPEHKECGLHLK
ncbi:MAG: phosphoadenylyl-sulfate reductase [Phycisphaerae bacterium]|nr:phosphoadenylyl-sulfate reductase [Phycisphaerae bacterium]